MASELASRLAGLTVLDEHGAPVTLGSTWRDRPAVLAFVRHFGWLHCREQVVQLHRDVDRIHAAGGELVVIGNGAPAFIAGFRDETGYAGRLYTDPSLEAYRAAQLRRGLSTVLSVGAITRSVGAYRRGFRQGKLQGDSLQQGGTLVIDTRGEVRFHHVSEGPGDHARIDDISAAVRAAAVAAAPA